MVGGLGERYTRVAAAHSVHNGLTVLPQTEKFLHGTKVAYCILVQSALLGQDDVLAQLITAYQRFNLPTRLAQLDVDINPSGITMQARRCILKFSLMPISSFWSNPRSFSMRQRNIYWRGSATRWRSGTRPSCLRLSQKTCH